MNGDRVTKSESRRRTVLCAVRLYPAERQALASAAERRGVSVGELIRQALRDELEDAHGGIEAT